MLQLGHIIDYSYVGKKKRSEYHKKQMNISNAVCGSAERTLHHISLLQHFLILENLDPENPRNII